MWVCKNHITYALKLVNAPHVKKVTMDITCSFCDEKAVVKMYYSHKPIKKSVRYTLKSTNKKEEVKTPSMLT
ncbi:hypothetical protein [Calidifontibacillus erzurumensis]|uniref:Uncharacterized protein n=1 Tax=Calidifontibacillus erzurumensis TaxID=2741433 RepID=A0A8J8GGP0_9BACI|nr:hypothetical protein [Calidifontibacillus erzurumensis]NSL53082.1 hypothetical protein [Calidifontibacillus erzurumensis]